MGYNTTQSWWAQSDLMIEADDGEVQPQDCTSSPSGLAHVTLEFDLRCNTPRTGADYPLFGTKFNHQYTGGNFGNPVEHTFSAFAQAWSGGERLAQLQMSSFDDVFWVPGSIEPNIPIRLMLDGLVGYDGELDDYITLWPTFQAAGVGAVPTWTIKRSSRFAMEC